MQACDSDERCRGGTCIVNCPADQVVCEGACVNPMTDPTSCGACGLTCAAGEFCDEGTCSDRCGEGTTACDGSCVDTELDPANCGACGTACADTEVCSESACGTVCGGGTTLCDGACADTDSDRANCGGCGVACPDTEACVGGACQPLCPTGQIACDGSCVDPNSDAAHCGGCETACAMAEICRDAACDTARPLVVVTTVTRDESQGEDAWLISEGGLDRPRRLNPSRFDSGTVTAAQLTDNGDVVLLAAQDTEGLYELYVARATDSALSKLNAELPDGVGILAWALSPDGTRLVYVTSEATAATARVFTVSLDMPGVATSRDDVLAATHLALDAEITDAGDVFVLAEGALDISLHHIPAGSTTPTQISPVEDGSIVEDDFQVSSDGLYAVYEFAGEGDADIYVHAVGGSSTALGIGGTSVFLGGVGLSDGLVTVVAYSVGDTPMLEAFSLDAPATRTSLDAASRFQSIGRIALNAAGTHVVFAAYTDGFYDLIRPYAIALASPSTAIALAPDSLDYRNLAGIDVGPSDQAVGVYDDGEGTVRMAAASIDGASPPVALGAVPGTQELQGDPIIGAEGALVFASLYSEDAQTRELWASPLSSVGAFEQVPLGLEHEPFFSELMDSAGGYALVLTSFDRPDDLGLLGFAVDGSDRGVRLTPAFALGALVEHASLRSDGQVAVYVVEGDDPGVRDVFAVAAAAPGVATRINPDWTGGANGRRAWIVGDRVLYTGEVDGDEHLYEASYSAPGAASLVASGVVQLEEVGGRIFVLADDAADNEVVYELLGDGSLSLVSVDGTDVRDFIVSDDGNHLYYRESSARDIWHADLTGAAAPLRMTSEGHDVDFRDFDTCADGSRVVYIGDDRQPGIEEAWMVELASPETEVQLNVNLSGTSRDVQAIQISDDCSYVVWEADSRNSIDELFGVDPTAPQTSEIRLHTQFSSTATDVLGFQVVGSQVVFRADPSASREGLYVASFGVTDAETELVAPLSTSRDVQSFLVEGDHVVVAARLGYADEIFTLPVDGSSERVARSREVVAAEVGVIRPRGGQSTGEESPLEDADLEIGEGLLRGFD